MDKNIKICVIGHDNRHKPSTKKCYSYNLPLQTRVLYFRRMIANELNIHENVIELSFQGDLLSDEKTLEYYDMKDGDTISTVTKLLPRLYYFRNLSILPLNDGYDKLELRDVLNIRQIINEIHCRYNFHKIHIQLYNNADKTGSIININDIPYNDIDLLHPIVYYLIEDKIDKYKIFAKLGVGYFGVTFLCKENSSSEIYAVKQFKMSKEGNNSKINIDKQLASLLSLKKHPRIIELIKQIDNVVDSSYLLMEYIDQGSIGYLINRNGALSETKSMRYAQQILEGLEYLHVYRIIHGNIKGSNILIDKNDNVKLSDFGLMTIFHNISNRNLFNEELQSTIYVINWLSPEMIRGGQLVPASDIWSFGAVMVEMITGKIPHYDLSVSQIVSDINDGQIRFTCPVFYKDHVKSFINICLKVQPRERANFDELYEHSFLK